MPLEDEFGDVIGKARRGHGLSPSAVASAVGLTEDALAAIERYERLPTRDEVGQFARLFSLPADRLWDIATEAWDAPSVPLMTRPPASLRIECVTLPYPVHCFLVAAADGSCLVIDTGTEAGPLLAKIRETDLAGGGNPHHARTRRSHRRPDRGAAGYRGAGLHWRSGRQRRGARPAGRSPPHRCRPAALVGITGGTGHPYAWSHTRQSLLPDRQGGFRWRHHVCRLRRRHALPGGLSRHPPVRPGAAVAATTGDTGVPGSRSRHDRSQRAGPQPLRLARASPLATLNHTKRRSASAGS